MRLAPLPKLVIFDLDGTLVDSVPEIAIAIDHTLREMHLPVAGEERVRHWVGNGLHKLVERALRFAEHFSTEYQHQAITLFEKHYAEVLNQKSPLYHQVVALLTELKRSNICMALCTNKPEQFVWPLLKHHQIETFFSLVVGGDTVSEKKPSPLPLHFICNSLDISPSDTWMVGDSQADALSAEAAGVAGILLKQGYSQGLDLTALPHLAVFQDIESFLASITQ